MGETFVLQWPSDDDDRLANVNILKMIPVQVDERQRIVQPIIVTVTNRFCVVDALVDGISLVGNKY